jgi:acylphosphatase
VDGFPVFADGKMAKTRAHVLVSGSVQGVFFRQNTKHQAQGRGVVGWVRNLLDGRVEAVFEGEEDAVRALVEFCKKGPPGAYVTDVSVDWEPFRGEFSSFQVAY